MPTAPLAALPPAPDTAATTAVTTVVTDVATTAEVATEAAAVIEAETVADLDLGLDLHQDVGTGEVPTTIAVVGVKGATLEDVDNNHKQNHTFL